MGDDAAVGIRTATDCCQPGADTFCDRVWPSAFQQVGQIPDFRRPPSDTRPPQRLILIVGLHGSVQRDPD